MSLNYEPSSQCKRGHILCGDCHVQCKDKCPTCTVPLEGIRNRALERVCPSSLLRYYSQA